MSHVPRVTVDGSRVQVVTVGIQGPPGPPSLSPDGVITVEGDLIIGGAGGTPEALAVGTSGQVLTGGTRPTWTSDVQTQLDGKVSDTGDTMTGDLIIQVSSNTALVVRRSDVRVVVVDTAAPSNVGILNGVHLSGYSDDGATSKWNLDSATGATRFDGTVIAGNTGAWDGGHLRLGPYHLWVDATGDLRIKASAPLSATDGVVVGTQS